MADLIDRLSGESEEMIPERPKLPVHQLVGGFRLYAHNVLTRAEISTEFDLQGSEATQAGLIADTIDAETGVANKVAQVLKLEAIMFMVENSEDTLYHNEDGSVDKTRVQTDGGF